MAAVDYFLKIDGVTGESPDAKHKDEIQLESWSWGESQGGTHAFGGGGGAGKVQMQDFVFTMKVNKSSPVLFLKCANGEHIKSAILTCRKAGKDQQEFMTFKFGDVLISSFQTSGAGSGDVLPMENISMNYTTIEYEYKMQKSDGQLAPGVKFKYDLKQMKAG